MTLINFLLCQETVLTMLEYHDCVYYHHHHLLLHDDDHSLTCPSVIEPFARIVGLSEIVRVIGFMISYCVSAVEVNKFLDAQSSTNAVVLVTNAVVLVTNAIIQYMLSSVVLVTSAIILFDLLLQIVWPVFYLVPPWQFSSDFLE